MTGDQSSLLSLIIHLIYHTWEMHCFYLVPCRGEKYQATPLKQDFGTSYLVGVLFKMSDKHRCPFDFRVPRREGRAVQAKKKPKNLFVYRVEVFGISLQIWLTFTIVFINFYTL